ncbi:26S proteasome non-ATPase regulatory subunit 11 [Tieghemostelium lacteum]|uniref:26S proteasome non-ATPase regulatory subunit 11 n=1 Tax=Tieghemostelium lacteum TaxID=361077 RepID=A0A151ZCA6_TIELA|nr:26S proteasome non-ATPase regulatory subunit 11 [Tieghemostelium lacteum]|eukprot:KYQ91582.1 26S proteasome non-ATPase regulatory subunit 11 [Tieghemostelium lacteum]
MAQYKQELDNIKSLEPEKAIGKYKQLLDTDASDDIKESAINNLAQAYVKIGKVAELPVLLKSIRPFFDKISKPKTDKIVRNFIDYASTVPNNLPLLIEFCKENIQWCKETNRIYLRQRLETKLYLLMFENQDYTSALTGLTSLLSEIKRLDDKPLLVEIQLIESRIQHALKNIAKARAALTSARTNANTIYCPPKLQAEIDMQSGILHSEEKDFKTSFSYFYESFDTYDTLEDPIAVQALKYMLLCKIMTNHTDDVYALVNGKIGLKYHNNRSIEAMLNIAKSHAKRSLKMFQGFLQQYNDELTHDPIIHSHLSELYNNLLEQNLCRIIEPFSRVEIAHIAKLIDLPVDTVERKLSLMILDKKYNGILDQGTGTLIVFNEQKEDKLFNSSLDTMTALSKVVDLLYDKTNKLS